jgi:hypothetical protein
LQYGLSADFTVFNIFGFSMLVLSYKSLMRVTFEKKTTAHLTAWITQQQQLDRIRAEAAAAAIEVISQQQVTGVGFLALTRGEWVAAPLNLLVGHASELVHLKRHVVSTLFILGGN